MTIAGGNTFGDGRFVVQRQLGAGGMGIVYEALDTERQSRVALKVLRDLTPAALARFKREYRALQHLQHPNLVSLGELVADADHWFFSMELVEGCDLLTYVCHGPNAKPRVVSAEFATEATLPSSLLAPEAVPGYDEDRLRAAFAQVAAGVLTLHAAGMIHRDLKPSNILVDVNGRAVILDLGLVLEQRDRDHSLHGHAIGTAAYMAPEQAAAHDVSPAADWYAVGSMLYEALTGRLPFTGSAVDIFMNKQQHEPPPPTKLVPAVPQDLNDLCVGLLRFHPRDRPTGPDVARALGASASPFDGHTHLSTMGDSDQFVGREAELDKLSAAFHAMSDYQARVVVVRGESGLGKSALIEHFIGQLGNTAPTAVTLAGRCYERESIPYKAFDGVVDALARWLDRQPPPTVGPLLPRGAALLPRMFPVLGRVELIARAPLPRQPLLDHHEVRRRVFEALRELLTALAETRPLVVTIDDLQWADTDSLLLLGDLMRPPNPPPLLLLISCRDNCEVELGHAAELIELGALDEECSRRLARALLKRAGALVHAQAELIAREAQGHPLYIDELVRHTASSTNDGPDSIPHLDSAIWRRASSLSETARQVVELVALAGAPLSREALRVASRVSDADLERQLALLRVANLVRSSGAHASDLVEPYHDRVREAIQKNLDEDTRRQHHQRLAIALEVTEGRPALLLRHLEGAGQHKGAGKYALEAARGFVAALAFDQAVAFFQAALRLEAYDTTDERRGLLIELRDALTNAGRGAEAAEAALAAAEGADSVTRQDCLIKAAEQLLVSGYIDRGMEVLRELVADIGVRLPATPRHALLSILWHRLLLRLRGLRWKARHIKEIAEKELIRVDVFKAVSHGLALVDNVRGADFQSRGLLLALRTGETTRIARALGTEAVYVGSQGGRGFARAQRLIAQMSQLTDEEGSPYLRAWRDTVAGCVAYFEGDFARAFELLSGAEPIYRDDTTGTTWELNNTRMFGFFALRHGGRFKEIRARHEPYLIDAARRDDQYLETSLRLYGNQLWLASHDLEGAARNLGSVRWTPPDGRFHLQHWYELEARAETALYDGSAAEALERLRADFDGLKRSLLTRIQVVRSLSRFVHARLLLSANRDLAMAARLARALRGERIPQATTWSALLASGLAARHGDDGQCRDRLEDAQRAADAAGMAFCSAAIRRRRGLLIGGDEGAALLAESAVWFDEQGIANPERMTELVLPGFSPGA